MAFSNPLCMIRFDTDSPPDYLLSKINLPTIPTTPSKNIIISTKLKWGETDSNLIQNTLLSYASIDATVFVFLVTDNSNAFFVPANVFFYRTSILKSQKVSNEFLLPYVWECCDAPFDPLPKYDKPVVGFCGLISQHRVKTLKTIYNSPQITSNFIVRNQFWGGRPHAPDLVNDFLENIRNSHFTVCNRGAGNFSMRFYQTLACGRIPVLLNTDMILPFDDCIDWNSIIVFADSDEVLVDKLLHYWETRDIIMMQHKCRQIFDEYFAGTRFFDKVLLSHQLDVSKCEFFLRVLLR